MNLNNLSYGSRITNNQNSETQTITDKKNRGIHAYDKLMEYYRIMDDKILMTENIDYTNKKFEELVQFDYNGFNSSFFVNLFKENLEIMKNNYGGGDVNSVVLHFEAMKECDDIYKRFKGDNDGEV